MKRDRWRPILFAPLLGLLLFTSPGPLSGADDEACPGCRELIRETMAELQARGWWGAMVSSCTPDTPGVSAAGLLVMEVADEGPAEAAGLRAGDVIVVMDGTELGGLDDEETGRLLAAVRPGDRLDLRVHRDGEVLSVDVRAIRMPYLEMSKALGDRLIRRYGPPRAPQIVGDPPGRSRP